MLFGLEDEMGQMNVTCFDDVYQKFGHAIVLSPYATVKGFIQRIEDYPAFIATSVHKCCPKIIEESQSNQDKLKSADFLVS